MNTVNDTRHIFLVVNICHARPKYLQTIIMILIKKLIKRKNTPLFNTRMGSKYAHIVALVLALDGWVDAFMDG